MCHELNPCVHMFVLTLFDCSTSLSLLFVLAFLYARGARQGSVEGPDMWNQVLDNALRKLVGRWESEGICKDFRRA